MTPEVSRACGFVIDAMGLVSGPVLDELIKAGEAARTPADLPQWARAVLATSKDLA